MIKTTEKVIDSILIIVEPNFNDFKEKLVVRRISSK